MHIQCDLEWIAHSKDVQMDWNHINIIRTLFKVQPKCEWFLGIWKGDNELLWRGHMYHDDTWLL
jgi:hypothetical protein